MLICCQTVAVKSSWGVLPDERTGLSVTSCSVFSMCTVQEMKLFVIYTIFKMCTGLISAGLGEQIMPYVSHSV